MPSRQSSSSSTNCDESESIRAALSSQPYPPRASWYRPVPSCRGVTVELAPPTRSTLDADLGLVEVAFRAERATICLTSALARHDLTDEIPATIDLALPRGTRSPATTAPITWHKFDPKTFDLGRDHLDVGAGYRIGLYSAERSICDAFRIRHLEGTEQAVEALKRWLRRPGSQPSQLLELATAIGPKAARPIRSALQILL